MAILITYDNGNRVPDVMEFVIMLSPTETPMLSGFRKTQARQTLHEWQIQVLDTKNDNAVPEGATFGDSNNKVPTRPTNITQIFEKVYDVSSTEAWVRSYHTEDQFAYQQQNSLKEIGTDIELAIVRGSIASGNNGAASARRMAGLQNFITTNSTTVNSGTKLTESGFNDMIEAVYDEDSNIGAPVGTIDEVHTSSRLKRVISAYTAGSTKNLKSSDRRLVNAVDVYESDFGVHKIFLSRYVTSVANVDAAVLFLGRKENAIAIGEPVKILTREQVAQTVHGEKGVIRGELTLETNEAFQTMIKGLSKDFN